MSSFVAAADSHDANTQGRDFGGKFPGGTIVRADFSGLPGLSHFLRLPTPLDLSSSAATVSGRLLTSGY